MALSIVRWNRLFWGLAIVGFLAGLYGIYDRIAFGHLNANYGSYVPWGLWVAGYIYLIGLSAGAFLMSALVYVFRVQRLKKIGKLALLTALATLVGALLMIWMDIGHPQRAWRLLLRTNFSSVMGWMVWLYTAYFVLLVVELVVALRADFAARANAPGLRGAVCRALTFGRRDTSPQALERDSRMLQILGAVGVPLAIAFHGSVGAIFGVVGARPYWNSGLTPIMFLVGALLSGGALLTFITTIWGPDPGSDEHRDVVGLLGRITLGLLAFDVLLEWAEYSTGLWNAIPAEAASLELVLFGPYWWAFWILHVGLGVVLAGLLLIVRARSVAAVGTAGALIAATFLTVRLNIVIPGLAVAELNGLERAFTGPGLTFAYVPSLTEWLAFVWLVSLAAIIFLMGRRFLPIVPAEQ